MTTYQHADIQGCKIFYRKASSTANPTIVLLHGFSSPSPIFRKLIPPLASRFHLLLEEHSELVVRKIIDFLGKGQKTEAGK